MKEAYERPEKKRKIEKGFEIASWVVKPLHNVPLVGEGLSLAEDLKDVAVKWMDKKITDAEWYLIGSRMTDIAIRDYLKRKSNFLPNQSLE
jgi:hypothetical protein